MCFHKNCNGICNKKTSNNLNKNLCLGTILSEHASESPSINSFNFGLFIMIHQLASSKLSYFAQTCQLARMTSTWMEIFAKIILHSHLASGGFPHCMMHFFFTYDYGIVIVTTHSACTQTCND